MQSAMPEPSGSSGLREAVLAGPAGATPADAAAGINPLWVVASPGRVRAALAAAGHADQRSRALTGAVTTVLVLGLCLFSGTGCAVVLARLWPLLIPFNPRLVMSGPVTAVALSQARARLSPRVLEALFTAGTRREHGDLPGLRTFGLVVTAVDGTVVDLPAARPIRRRFAIPAGGRFPQARLVTLVACGTRRILGAVMDSCAVAEPVLWDRLAGHLTPGTLNLADRGFFSLRRWHTATGTGAQLIWRVKNGTRALPVRIIAALPDGSVLVVLRESDAMLSARRKAAGDRTLARLPEVLARLVEFTVTGRDASGRSSKPSRFRVLTTLLDHDAYPARQVAACYAQRWQVELVYKSIKSTLRGAGRRLRGQTPELVEQEIWGLLAVYNAVVDQAVAAAVDLGVDPDEISFTAALWATRDHLITGAPCPGCGHQPGARDLTAAITTSPRNPTDRQRTSPRTKKDRQTQHTRDVTYTIRITEPALPRATEEQQTQHAYDVTYTTHAQKSTLPRAA